MLPAFACTRAIGNLWYICLGVNIWVVYLFYWLLKLRIFSTILRTLSLFSFSGISFLITAFFNSLIEKIVWLTISLSLIWFALSKSFAINDEFWYLEYSLNISLIMFSSSFLISLTKFYFNLNRDILILGILICALVCLDV